jgi:hypothetical protein
MTLLQRRLFMLFFIVVFMIVAPIIVLFAKGYRFNLENGIFIYSGSITIKSWPRNVDIYLNGKKQTDKNYNVINDAYTINGIKPGNYTLSCKKEGYTDWNKNINVHSGLSTEFWNVVLFPKESVAEKENFESSADLKQFFLSPRSEEEIVLFSKNKEVNSSEVHLLNTETKKTSTLYSSKKLHFIDNENFRENIEWNSNNKNVIIPFLNQEKEKKYKLIELNKEEAEQVYDLNQLFNKEEEVEKQIKKVHWMFDKKEEMIILTNNQELYHFNYKATGGRKLIDKNVSGFDFAGDDLFYSKLPHNIVWKTKQDNLEKKEQVTGEKFSFTNQSASFVNLTVYDKNRFFIKNKSGESYIFNRNPEKNEVKKITMDSLVENIQFSDDGKKILCWNNYEIWYYMLRDWEIQPKRESGEKITITRFSAPIKNIQWMENYENIIFSINKTIKSSGVDPRNKLNITDLFQVSQELPEKSVIYNKRNQILYYLDEGDLKSVVLIDKLGFLGF